MVSGTAGSGKSSVAAHFARAACRRGDRCLYFAFEESAAQIIRNMRSIGIDLEPHVRKGLLRIHATRSNVYGLEMHLATIHKLIQTLQPRVVVLDPISNLKQAGSGRDAAAMLTRLIDNLKMRGITTLLTCMTDDSTRLEHTDLEISSLVDTWLLLRDIELGGERNRAMYVLKSRGMAHSNQIREFLLTNHGIELADVYLGAEGVLTGSARLSQEAREKAAALQTRQNVEARQRDLERKREALEARIAALRKDFEAEQEEATRIIEQEAIRAEAVLADRKRMARSRKADNGSPNAQPTAASIRRGVTHEKVSQVRRASRADGDEGRGRGVGAASVRRRANAQVDGGIHQPQEDL
jgi:circadian clock protein KaiC